MIGKKLIIQSDEADEIYQTEELLRNNQLQDVIKRVMKNQKPEKAQITLEKEEITVFCDVIAPPARLIVIGGSHIAIPLVVLARLVDFSTVLVDARSAFANHERFPSVDEIVVGWPAEVLEKLEINENTFVAFVSHDDKFDVPALKVALQSKARYIGALGSRKTHANRVARLLEESVPMELIEQIHAPIGLDIGASGAAEIAVSILAEMLAVRNGKVFTSRAAALSAQVQ